MVMEERTMRLLVIGLCCSFVAAVAAAVFMAVSLPVHTEVGDSRSREVTVDGGGCPADSSVLATTGGERLGSTGADGAGDFKFSVQLPEGDGARSVSVSCGAVAFTVGIPASDTTSSDRSAVALLALIAGALVLVAVLVVLLRRRLAIDLRDSATGTVAESSESPDRELSEVALGRNN
jgi:hypothetical protein